MIEDNAETWSLAVGEQRTKDRRRSVLWFYATPTFVAAPFLILHVELKGAAQLLAGVAVFTGLLFGLLVLMFNTGVTLRKDGAAFASAHDLRRVIADLRANVTYAILIAMLLDLLLVVAAATTDPTNGLAWGWTVPIVWLFVHLGLTLLAILRRFRTAFNYITR